MSLAQILFHGEQCWQALLCGLIISITLVAVIVIITIAIAIMRAMMRPMIERAARQLVLNRMEERKKRDESVAGTRTCCPPSPRHPTHFVHTWLL